MKNNRRRDTNAHASQKSSSGGAVQGVSGKLARANGRSSPADERAKDDGRSPHEIPEPVWDELATTMGLSRREREIARLILGGLTEGVIAERLGISRHTVHSHIHRIFVKTGVRSQTALAGRLFAAYCNREEMRPRAGER